MAASKKTTAKTARKSTAKSTAKSARKSTAKSASKAAASSRARAKRVAAEVEEEWPAEPGTTSLVIVESPAKARTISKYLGRGYRVKATVGHVRDLPEKKLGIDVDANFEPQYVTIAGKEKTVADIKAAARNSREIFLATDPDREGEAIAWHVAEQLKVRGKSPVPMRRVLFHEITKDAVQRALANAGEIDDRKVDAQQARRVLDRLVGYKASPLLWKTVKKGLSAGRVQTVALRLIVERERGIRAFNPVEYWTIEALLDKDGQQFSARLHQVDGAKPEIGDETRATTIVDAVRSIATAHGAAATVGGDLLGAFPITEIKRRERRKNPAAPFTTSTLQQEAAKRLSFGSKRTMRVAQSLYEGIELGSEEGAVGLITYMRTDSTRISEVAAGSAREHLRVLFGEQFLASGLQLYGDSKAKKTQDAHEGIRPTDPARRPELVKRYLKEDQYKLYQLIWQRFMASQMAPAVFDTTTVDYDLSATGAAASLADTAPGNYLFRSTGSVMKFAGFLTLYREAQEDGDAKALEDEQALPLLERGEVVPARSVDPSQHFTEPPPRFSEASLVKELERLGIGRPSTYASIISTLADRHYVELTQRRFFPTSLGESVEKVMVRQFPAIFDVGFTSEMENELDKVEEGSLEWRNVLRDFYLPFAASLQDVDFEALIGEAHDLSKLETERCPDCGGKLMAKAGFFGPFVACENHPKECKFTRPVSGEKKKAEMTDYICDLCGAPMLKRSGRSGEFLGCSRFPKCRGTRSMPTGIFCPKDGGELAEKRGLKSRKKFYGCENHPNCDFVCWDKPVKETCPECGFEGAEAKSNKTRGAYRKCLKCANEWDAPETDAETEVAGTPTPATVG